MDSTFQALLAEVDRDTDRNQRFLHLTPNEPVMSDTARQFLLSPLSDRYYFGPGVDGVMDNGAFTSLGLTGVGKMVDAASEVIKQTLGANVVNLNCLSGVHAMMCVLLSTTKAGDTVMTLDHDHGGHFATKGILKQTGRRSIDTVYDFENQCFDAAATAARFHESGATLLYMDVSYYTAPIDIKTLRDAIGPDAIIAFDASHTFGLMMGGAMPSPLLEGADIVCANTHKTLPGPQKGLIAFRAEELGNRANDIINGCLFSSAHTGSLLALSTTILEMDTYGHDYAEQVVANSQALGEALAEHGFDVRQNLDGTYSRTHQVHLRTDTIGNRRDIYDALYRNSIAVAFDSPTILQNGTFIRLGTQETTRRGMKQDDMKTIARFIHDAVNGKDIKQEVEAFKQSFSEIHYSFDAHS